MSKLFFTTLGRPVLASVVVVMLTTTVSMAAGLGKLRTDSLIGELLKANVMVSGLDEVALKSARIAIAPDDVWQSAGVAQTASLANLRFRIDPTTSRVQITSVAPFRQPSVDVILELSTGKLRVQRWYTIAPAVAAVVSNAAEADVVSLTVVADQPALARSEIAPENRVQVLHRADVAASSRASVAADEKVAAVKKAAPKPKSPALSSKEVISPKERKASPKAKAKAVLKNGLYGPIKSGETLFSIASKNQPAGVTMNQVMAAIIRTNPQVFGSGVRSMAAGANVYIPPKSVMLLASDSKARQQVRGGSVDKATTG